MSFWNFIGGFALFNAVCDLFSGKPKRTCVEPKQHFHDYDSGDYLDLSSDFDRLQNRINELEERLAETDVMSERYDELRDQIDEL